MPHGGMKVSQELIFSHLSTDWSKIVDCSCNWLKDETFWVIGILDFDTLIGSCFRDFHRFKCFLYDIQSITLTVTFLSSTFLIH